MFDFMMSSLPDWDDEEAVRNFREMANSIAGHMMLVSPPGKNCDVYCMERHAEGPKYDLES